MNSTRLYLLKYCVYLLEFKIIFIPFERLAGRRFRWTKMFETGQFVTLADSLFDPSTFFPATAVAPAEISGPEMKQISLFGFIPF